MQQRHRSTPLRLEQLEDRVVPAGNVTVSVLGTTVRVTGDSADNGVEISLGTSADQFVFRGLDNTTINGQTTPLTQTVTGGLAHLKIRLGKGADDLVITNRSEADHHWPGFTAPTAASNLVVDRHVSIDTGIGADTIQLRNVDIGGDLTLDTGGVHDTRVSNHEDRKTERDLTLGAGSDDDTAVLQSVSVAGDLTINSEGGDDSFLLGTISVVGTTTITNGRGKDAVGLYDSDFSQDVSVALGRGNDSVAVESNHLGGLLDLKGGRGRNEMTRDLGGLNTIDDELRSDRLTNTLPHLADVEFSDTGDSGPDHWGELAPAFLLTSIGRQQSPIDIQTANAVSTDLPDLDFNFNAETNIPFVHDGHTVRANFPAGSNLDINGATFSLQQFHFHAPGEHPVDGVSFALELHMVLTDGDGHVVVVSTLITAGAANAAYAPVVDNLPDATHTSATIPGPLQPEDLLPTDRTYFAYTGSFTTPPGTEGVAWAVFTTAVELSTDQINAIKTALGASNARPVQPVNDRVVFID